MKPTKEMIEAAIERRRTIETQGFLYGNRHVLRDIEAERVVKETVVIWEETTDDYKAGHAAMENAAERHFFGEIITASLAAMPAQAVLPPVVTGQMEIDPDVTAADLGANAEPAPMAVCERCHGNGEIVTDWDRYRHPHPDDKGDEAVAECPDCGGEGIIDVAPSPAPRAPDIAAENERMRSALHAKAEKVGPLTIGEIDDVFAALERKP